MTIAEFRKKAIYFNKVTEGKKVEEVERDVNFLLIIIFFSFGKALIFPLHYM